MFATLGFGIGCSVGSVACSRNEGTKVQTLGARAVAGAWCMAG